MLAAIVAVVVAGVTLALLFGLDVFGGSSSSTTEGSGVSATQVRHVAPFDSVELAGSNNVVIRVGEAQSVVVRADDNLLGRVTTEVDSGKLVVANTSGSFTANSPMRVAVSIPTLEAITLTGSGNIVVEGVEGDSLEVTLPGSGTITGTGTVTRLDVTVGGSGTVQFGRLGATDVRAVVSGSGTIVTTATGSLDASVSGSGAILYAGDPQKVTKSVTGTGAITGT